MWSVWPAASSHSHNESTLALSSDTIQHAPPHKANTKTQTQTQTHKQRHRHIWTPTQTRTHRYRHTCIQQHTHINLVAADYSYIEGSNVLKQFNGFQRKYFPSPILIEMWCRQVSPVKLKIAGPPPLLSVSTPPQSTHCQVHWTPNTHFEQYIFTQQCPLHSCCVFVPFKV